MFTIMNYHFNPFEISICGYSGLGKTTLICKLIQSLSKTYRMGYIKHDAHHFEMDKKGKDTYKVSQSGASSVGIYSSQKNTMAIIGENNNSTFTDIYNDFDIVLIEGLKGVESLPKIVFLDESNAILDEVDDKDIILTISSSERDNITRAENAIRDYFLLKITQLPLYGLVLTGGYSKRMGKDKAFLNYTNKNQYQHCLDLLAPTCEKVFLSCRETQVSQFDADNDKVVDQFLNMGPLGGIMSAQKQYPNVAWLVIACDLPFLTTQTLTHLIKNRHPYKMATAFRSAANSFPEPLCAIYEPKSYHANLNFLGRGCQCPRKILANTDCHLIDLIDLRALDNINTMEGFKEIMEVCHD